MQSSFFPDFFIVGAPRCGTTSLSRYLASNSQICFSKPKEPHYFSKIVEDCSPLDVRDKYVARYFRHCGNGFRAAGEGSVSYLYSQHAIDNILRFNPEAKFIAMVRNPIDMIHSYHYRMLYITEEEVDDFATAWNLQESRAQGEKIPRHCREPRLLQYGKVARLGEQIEGLFEKAGRERCLVNVFDDFTADTLKVYKQTLAFLDVDYDGRTHFPRKMESKTYRSCWLQRLIYQPPKTVVRAIEASEAKERPTGAKRKKPFIKRLRKRLVKINRIKQKPPPLDENLRAALRETFAEDIQRLGQLLNRDLSHWR